MRASDQDRNVAIEVLADAYADGRLDREEYDERMSQVATTKTLGDLTGHLAGLVAPQVPVTKNADLALASSATLQQRAEEEYRSAFRGALTGFLIPSIITWVIWIATGFHGGSFNPVFPWPIFVSLGTGINVVRMITQKDDLIKEERRKLERKQQKALDKQNAARELGTTNPATEPDSE